MQVKGPSQTGEGLWRVVCKLICKRGLVDAAEFALWLAPPIITRIDKILARLFRWTQPPVDAYLRVLVMAAEHSGWDIVADVPGQLTTALATGTT
jgi:hypothetical protein